LPDATSSRERRQTFVAIVVVASTRQIVALYRI
jgi:hypothetical protein